MKQKKSIENVKLVGHTVSGISDLNVQSFIKCMFVYVFRVHWCCGGGGDSDGNGGALHKPTLG